MALLNPGALLYALLIGVLLLVHLRRRPRRTYWVPDLQLWQSASAVRDARPVLKRPRLDWLLLLQVGVLAALVLALSRPLIRFWDSPARSVAIVMDRSASMAVRERGGSRFELARQKALSLLDEIGGHDQVLLIEAGLRPVARRFTGSEKPAVGAALKAMRPTQAPADVGAAVLLALTSAPQAERPDVFVFTDGAQNSRAAGTSAPGQVRYVQTGETDDNLAITRLSVRSNPMSPYDREVFVEVGNFSARPKTCRLAVSLGSTLLIEQMVTLAPGERKPLAATVPLGLDGVILASLDARDGLDADNRAYAVTGPPSTSILLVTAGNLFLERALQVNPRVRTVVKRPEDWSPADARREFDAIVLDGFAPRDRPAANYLAFRYGQPAPLLRGVPSLVAARPGHAVTALLDLGGVVLEEAASLEAPPSGVVLITGAGQPLVVASESGAFRSIDVGFDIRASNLPLTAAFPVFLSNALRWLIASQDDLEDRAAAGVPLRWRVTGAGAGGAATARVTRPDGATVNVPVNDGAVVYAETDLAGIYEVRYGSRSARFAVSLLDAAESDVRPAAGPGGGAPHPAVQPHVSRPGRAIERALLYLAFGLWTLEWLYSINERRRRGIRRPQPS